MMTWNAEIKTKFDQLIGKIPIFLRDIAKDKVSKKAESIVTKEGRLEVTEKDLVDAFFAETPFGFHGPLKTDMQEFGINYMQYGYDR